MALLRRCLVDELFYSFLAVSPCYVFSSDLMKSLSYGAANGIFIGDELELAFVILLAVLCKFLRCGVLIFLEGCTQLDCQPIAEHDIQL